MKIITMICWFMTAIVLVGFAIWFLTGTIFGIRSDKWNNNNRGLNLFSGINVGSWEVLSGLFEAVGTYSPDAAGIEALNIDWIAGDVTIKPYDGNDFQITEFAQRELQEHERLIISESGGSLTIKYAQNRNLVRIPQKKLEVLIPKQLSESLTVLRTDTVSGAILIEDISADTLKADTMSGRVNISNSAAQKLEIDTTSGSVTVAYVRADSMNLSSISGAVRMSESSAKTLNCDTTSGGINVSGDFDSVKLDSMSGRLTLDNSASASVVEADSVSGSQELSGAFDRVKTDSISGSVTIKSTIVPGYLSVDTTSGGITVTIPNEGTITVDHSSVSGRFSSDIPVVMQKRDAQFKLSTISGSAKILASM